VVAVAARLPSGRCRRSSSAARWRTSRRGPSRRRSTGGAPRGNPGLIYNAWRQAIVNHGIDAGSSAGIPVNTLYAAPELASPTAGGVVLTTGANTDTLYVAGWLDLAAGPQILHVPDMGGRYYGVQLLDPGSGTDFAYVGRRTTGTAAGDFLVTGPGWAGTVPAGMRQVASPTNSVFVIGRVLVQDQPDLGTAYGLA
jgi:hypothetical protein